MKEACEREVIELHRFFEEWFSADLPQTEKSFSRFQDVLVDGFTIVSPSGDLMRRAALLKGLYSAYGSRSGRIWIENFSLQQEYGGLAIVTYEEWQTFAGKTMARISTAIFQRDQAMPNGVSWLHVHETWLPMN